MIYQFLEVYIFFGIVILVGVLFYIRLINEREDLKDSLHDAEIHIKRLEAENLDLASQCFFQNEENEEILMEIDEMTNNPETDF